MEETGERVKKTEVVDDYTKILFYRHSRTATCKNAQHSENVCNHKPGQSSAWNGKVEQSCCGSFDKCQLAGEGETVLSENIDPANLTTFHTGHLLLPNGTSSTWIGLNLI